MYDTNMLIWTTEMDAAGHRVVNMLTVKLTGKLGRFGKLQSVQGTAKYTEGYSSRVTTPTL
jgi:hypothetical protein